MIETTNGFGAALAVERPSSRHQHRPFRRPLSSSARIYLILLGTLSVWGACIALHLSQPTHKLKSTPIGEIQLGANVPGVNPGEADDFSFGDSVDPETWRAIELTGHQVDGSLVEISLLRPEYWLHEHHAEPGGTIDAVEFGRLGVVGAARVKSVSPCPEVRAGPGRTVTGIYRHYASRLLDLRTDNGEELGTTPDHHFWSETRHAFVQAGDLEPGETLQLLDGTTRVTSITPRDKGAIVYTLEVQVEHVFHVANSGILVHNCDPKLTVADDAIEAAKGVSNATQPRNALGQFMSKTNPGQSLPGANAVDDFVDLSRKNGFDVVGKEISVQTPFGKRRYDVVLRNTETGAVTGVEIKSSRAAFERFDNAARQQFAADRWLNSSGGLDALGKAKGLFIDDAIKILWEVP